MYITYNELTLFFKFLSDLGSSYESVELPPHSTKVVPTSVEICFPYGFYGVLLSRRSGSSKGLVVQVELVTNDYVNEGNKKTLSVVIHNNSLRVFNIYHGNKIAELAIIQQPKFEGVHVDHMGQEWKLEK